MSQRVDQAAQMLGPDPSAGAATDPRRPQRLANTGTTESSNANALVENTMATYLNGGTAVRFRFSGKTGQAAQVAATDPIIPPYGRFDWTVEGGTRVLYIEAADSASAYEGHVWQSSP